MARTTHVFLWNEERTLGWHPIVSFQTGFGSSFGARLFHNNLFGHGESISAEARGGGLYSQAYQLQFHGDRIGGTRLWLDVRGRFDITPRLIFAGIGNPPAMALEGAALASNLDPGRGSIRTRYSQLRGLAAAALGWRFGRPGREIRPGGGMVFNHRTFDRERSDKAFVYDDDDDPSIGDVYDVDRLTGFREGVDVVRLFGSLELDYRNRRGRPSRGIYYMLFAGGAPPQARDVAYGHYGTELSGHFNLLAHTRILVLRAALEAVHGRSDGIPFSDLPRLGGPLRLRGYRLNSLRDRIAVMATAEYRFPIHQVVAGHLFIDVGRVARTYPELFENDAHGWRTGIGGGLEFRTLNRFYFRIEFSYGQEFLVAFSTDPLQAFARRHMLEL